MKNEKDEEENIKHEKFEEKQELLVGQQYQNKAEITQGSNVKTERPTFKINTTDVSCRITRKLTYEMWALLKAN